MTTELPTVAIIILTFNQKEKTLRCLASCKNINGVGFKILLWDNGSIDGTVEAVNNEFSEVLTFNSGKNLGVAAGRNACAQKAIKLSPEYLLFMDNDIVVEPDFLSFLVSKLSDPLYSIASPKIKLLDDKKSLYGAGGLNVIFKKGNTRHLGYQEIDYGQYDNVSDPVPSGGCFLVRTNVFTELKGFDEIFSPYGPEDIDFMLRAKARGYKTIYSPCAVIYHESKPSKTAQSLFSYSFRRIYHWLIILYRHAKRSELISFIFLYLPLSSAKMILAKYSIRNIQKSK